MRTIRAMAILAVFVLILTCTAGMVSAGVEPSPFRSDAGKLQTVVNNFKSMEKRLDDTLAMSPDPYNPSTVNKLEAMNNELETISKRVDHMLSNSRVDPGQIQGEYIGAHEAGHSFLSHLDEYVEGGFENMQITQMLRVLKAITLAIIDLLDPYIREG